MKYRWMFKDPDKLTVGDFDKEVFEGFCGKTNVGEMNRLNEITITFERLDTGEIVRTTDRGFVSMLQERAMDMVLDELADRVAERVKGREEAEGVPNEIKMPPVVKVNELPEKPPFKGAEYGIYVVGGKEYMWIDDKWQVVGYV